MVYYLQKASNIPHSSSHAKYYIFPNFTASRSVVLKFSPPQLYQSEVRHYTPAVTEKLLSYRMERAHSAVFMVRHTLFLIYLKSTDLNWTLKIL